MYNLNVEVQDAVFNYLHANGLHQQVDVGTSYSLLELDGEKMVGIVGVVRYTDQKGFSASKGFYTTNATPDTAHMAALLSPIIGELRQTVAHAAEHDAHQHSHDLEDRGGLGDLIMPS